MTIKDALFRQLKYGLCGASGALQGIVAQSHVKLDMRNTVSSTRSESDYPWLIFRRLQNTEDNQVRYARERIEIEVIGLRGSATKGDSLLETIREALVDAFAGKRVTIGKYTADGTADPTGGLLVSGQYIDTVEGFDSDLQEKAHVLRFVFAHVRS